MRRFIVTTEGGNRLGLRELCQRFADKRWMAAPEPAAASMLSEFKRAVYGEVELLAVIVHDTDEHQPAPSG
jgi:hypothetical protein